MLQRVSYPPKGGQIAVLYRREVNSYRELVVDAYNDDLYKPFTEEQKTEIMDAAEHAACVAVEYCAKFISHFVTYFLLDEERDIHESLRKYCNFLKSLMCDTLSHELIWCEWLLRYSAACVNWGKHKKDMELLMCSAIGKAVKENEIGYNENAPAKEKTVYSLC